MVIKSTLFIITIAFTVFPIKIKAIENNTVQSNKTEQQFKRQLANQLGLYNINTDDIKAPSYNEFRYALQKLTNSVQSWSTNNQEKVIEALGMYTVTFGVNNMITYCKPHYSMDKLTKVYDSQIISKRETAKNIIVKAGGTDLLKIFDDLYNNNSALFATSVNTDYLLARKESEIQGIANLTKDQYCKSLDDAAYIVPSTIEKLAKQVLNQAKQTANQTKSSNVNRSNGYINQPYSGTTKVTNNYSQYSRNSISNHASDRAIGRALGWAIFPILILILELLRYIKNLLRNATSNMGEQVKQKYIKHKNEQEKYRKYLRDCDKRGKTPLSYKQWKFAYADKKVKK
ncbi:MAG: hypothetical protein J5620_03505 [Alphaproteobacteria bacterium]|nr:hypothetical protein [Alphaproteobacteria bacterium]